MPVLVIALTVAMASPPLLTGNGEMAEMMMPMARPDAEVESGPTALAVTAGTPYRVVDLKGVGPTFVSSGPSTTDENGCGGSTRDIVPFAALPAAEPRAVLVPGDWPAVPRTISVTDATPQAHQAIVVAALALHGKTAADIGAGHAVRADLDGDGEDETILSATNVAPGGEIAKIGDYALLAVQRGSDGRVLPVTFEAIDESNLGMGDVAISVPIVLAIADLDGDGRMEIVAEHWGYEYMSVDGWSLRSDGSAFVAFQYSCAP